MVGPALTIRAELLEAAAPVLAALAPERYGLLHIPLRRTNMPNGSKKSLAILAVVMGELGSR